MLKVLPRWQPLPLLGMLAAALVAGPMAHAQTFSTAAGATTGGLPVTATATFHVTQSNVQIDVTNLTVNPTGVAQNISDLFFMVSAPQNMGLLTGSGAGINVANDGSISSAGVLQTTPGHWSLVFENGGFHLTALGAGQPDETIIGLPDPMTGKYLAAGGSIAGNGPHNPFLSGDVTFNVAIAGLSSTATVSDVSFSFGTVAGNDVPGVPGGPPQGNITPEGSSLFLMAPGLVPVLWFGVRRRFVKTA